MVEEGRFREDLYYRLAVFPVHLPSLREREGDVPPLAKHFLRKYALEEGKDITGISATAMRLLEAYAYPGNVRELENIISHAVVVAAGTELSLSDLPLTVLESGRQMRLVSDGPGDPAGLAGLTLEQAMESLFENVDALPQLEDVEMVLIRHAIRLCDGNIVQAAKALGMSRATVYRRLERLGGRQALLET
jgi:DNA-binding NtrC family response regulator